MESKSRSPRILSKLSKSGSSSKSATLSKDFKNKTSASSATLDSDKASSKSSKVSLSFKELKKQQDKKNKLEQQQLKIQQQQLKNEIKLQQKQLKIQQKKNEKEQQKLGTLKAIKNGNKSASVSETSANEPTPSTSSAIAGDDEKRFSDGVRFKGKLVGIEPVMAARGDKMCQNALKNLRLLRRSTSSHKQRITININLNGVQLLDQKTNDLVANHVINLISYITRDITDNRTFGYVYGTENCFVALCLQYELVTSIRKNDQQTPFLSFTKIGTPEVGHQFIAIKSEKGMY